MGSSIEEQISGNFRVQFLLLLHSVVVLKAGFAGRVGQAWHVGDVRPFVLCRVGVDLWRWSRVLHHQALLPRVLTRLKLTSLWLSNFPVVKPLKHGVFLLLPVHNFIVLMIFLGSIIIILHSHLFFHLWALGLQFSVVELVLGEVSVVDVFSSADDLWLWRQKLRSWVHRSLIWWRRV